MKPIVWYTLISIAHFFLFMFMWSKTDKRESWDAIMVLSAIVCPFFPIVWFIFFCKWFIRWSRK